MRVHLRDQNEIYNSVQRVMRDTTSGNVTAWANVYRGE